MTCQAFLDEMSARKGEIIGRTDWMAYSQKNIDAFSELTGEKGPIHNDPEWAEANTPFQSTLVQGHLLISSFTAMAKSLKWPEADFDYRLNYGYDRIRIMAPVKTDQRFCTDFTLKNIIRKAPLGLLATVEVKLQAEDNDKPSIIAEWLFYIQFKS